MLTRVLTVVWAACTFTIANAVPTFSTGKFQIRDSDGLQDIVTWDEKSIFVRGERILFYSGEFHPFRLPVPDLWLDVFQKIKALGYSGVSFYIDWALLEGQEGTYRADGVFALEPFFDAAAEAGIYLLARPGPYINAEVSGGGFPGWLSRVNATFRTDDPGFIHATDLYAASVGATIAKAQITNGGPVILFQPENEYTYPANNITFPNSNYFNYVMQQFRKAGIVVPMINNDASPRGIFAPGNDTVTAHVDIYGHDSYPQGFNCKQPYNWPGQIPTNFRQLHLQQSPSTPYSIVEFQGGSFDPWGGYGFDNCAALTNEQFERIFYKNNWSFGVAVFNIYMTYGGTNWGNLGHPLGYTSYDYGSPISEDRAITRAKYSETKLGANFLKVTPSYLTATPQNLTNETIVSTADISVTPIYGNGSATALYVVRHSTYNVSTSTPYTLTVSSSAGSITIPQLNQLSSTLTLDGRDSKVHVVDYDLGGTNLLYSSAEIFTWEKYPDKTILVLYGGAGETHELALPDGQCSVTSGDASTIASAIKNGHNVIQWQVTPASKVVRCGSVEIHLLWRNDAYNWWALELPGSSPVGNYTSPSKQHVILAGGYLMRTAQITNGDLYLTGDINATSTIYVVGAPTYGKIIFNGKEVGQSPFTVQYQAPQLSLPSALGASWSSINSLPEIDSSYSDNAWTVANKTSTVNQFKPPIPQVLYAGDYGYHSGSLMYRGHFQAPSDGNSLDLKLWSTGGTAYGYSVWLQSANLFQYPGISTSQDHNLSLALSGLKPGDNYVLTVLIDHMGLTENFNPGNDTMREPRGLRSYGLTTKAGAAVPVTWKLTGNLGGENYIDLTRGPLNEGGMYFERQGYHLPGAQLPNSNSSSPFDGFSGPGVRFYATTLKLDLPTPDYDIPLAFVFSNATSSSGSGAARFRCQLYVNGFQFGKYVNHIGPQTVYPVPEGILNYKGDNYIGLSLWNMEQDANAVVKLGSLELKSSSTPVMSGRGKAVALSFKLPNDGWHPRAGAY